MVGLASDDDKGSIFWGGCRIGGQRRRSAREWLAALVELCDEQHWPVLALSLAS